MGHSGPATVQPTSVRWQSGIIDGQPISADVGIGMHWFTNWVKTLLPTFPAKACACTGCAWNWQRRVGQASTADAPPPPQINVCVIGGHQGDGGQSHGIRE
jgi:hypothetical protein